jgi:hypothetical protein
MRRSLLALALACALTACGGDGDAGSGAADASSPSQSPSTTGASATPGDDASAHPAASKACTESGLAFTPLADGLAGGDLEGALLDAEVPAWEPSGTAPTVELALARMELELSFAREAAKLGVFGADGRSRLQRAYDQLADACEGIGSGF